MHMGANKLFFRLPRQHVQNTKEILNTEETNTAVKRTAHESEFELPVKLIVCAQHCCAGNATVFYCWPNFIFSIRLLFQ